MSAPVEWQKSSFSGGDGPNCLELARGDGKILIRESEDPGAVITTDAARFAAFLRGVRSGEFDHLLP